MAIETSCDETACAIVQDDKNNPKSIHLISETLATSKDIHESFGGVIPEIAARKQLESIIPVIDQCLSKANITKDHIDMLAVTVGPGLVGSLLIGVEAAKALAFAWNKPLVPVNHLIGHIYANFVDNPRINEIDFPALALVVSGGHTDIVLMRDYTTFDFLGGTLDDAAGEAFDKTARLLDISKYLGGAKLSKLAQTYTPELHGTLPILPRPMFDSKTSDMSFSGLKTAIKRVVASNLYNNVAVAYSFEQAVVDVLQHKVLQAADQYAVKCILLGGGVSANSLLRSRIEAAAGEKNIKTFVPPLYLCTDNAVYIAAAAYYKTKFSSYRLPQLSSIQALPSISINTAV